MTAQIVASLLDQSMAGDDGTAALLLACKLATTHFWFAAYLCAIARIVSLLLPVASSGETLSPSADPEMLVLLLL